MEEGGREASEGRIGQARWRREEVRAAAECFMSGTQKISQTDTDWCCRRTHSSPLGSLPLPVPPTLYHSYRSCLSPVCSGTPAPHTRNGCFTPMHKTKLNRGGLSFRWPSCSSNRSAVTGPERTIHKKNYLRQTMSGAARNRSGLWQKRLWVFKWKVRTEKVRKKLFQLWVQFWFLKFTRNIHDL